MSSAVDRFLDRVRIDERTGCWLWTGSHDGRQGYAKMSVDGKGVRVTRWVFDLFNPGKLKKHHVVGHTCDNPPCVNPEHLVRYTHRQNMKDKAKKGRVVVVKKFIDADTVSLIRFANQEVGISPRAIAREIGLKYTTVRSITEGRRWKSIT